MNEQENLLSEEVKTQRASLSADRMDISFGEIINLYKNKELIINPEYQRQYRWSNEQKTALIESLLLSIPIPPIFVAEDKKGIWELVDGLQRVTTFISFFGELTKEFKHQIPNQDYTQDDEVETDIGSNNDELTLHNKWSLGAGSLLKKLEGFNIDTLPTQLKINLKRTVCRVEILRGESQNAMKYELFKRLNSGGSKLTPQEIRNAIYRGINPKMNDILSELSKNDIFIELTGLSNKKIEELYNQELVLRFFAYFKEHNVNDSQEPYLNKFMDKVVKRQDFDYKFYQNIFKETLELINKTNDSKKIFRRGQKNQFVPLIFDCVMIGVAENINIYKNDIPLLEKTISLLKENEDLKSVQRLSSGVRIKERLKIARTIFTK